MENFLKDAVKSKAFLLDNFFIKKVYVYSMLISAFVLTALGVIYINPVVVLFLPLLFLLWAGYQFIFLWENLLIVLIASLFFIPVNVYTLPISLPFDSEVYRVITIAMLSLWFIALLIDKKVKWTKTPFDYPIFFLTGFVFLSLLLNSKAYEALQEFPKALKAFFYFTSFILVFYFVVSVITDYKKIEKVLKWVANFGMGIGVLGIIERLTGYNLFRHLHEWVPLFEVNAPWIQSVVLRGGIRVTGSSEHPLAFGSLLTMIVPFALYFFFSSKQLAGRLWYAFCLATLITATLFTGSRTIVIALIPALITPLFQKPRRILYLLVFIFALLFTIHMLMPGLLGSIRAVVSLSYVEKTEFSEKNPARGRIADYPYMLKYFQKKPLYGMGFGMFDPKRFFHVDNQYLLFLVETGIFGIFSLGWFFYRIIKEFWKFAKKVEGEFRDLVLSILAACLVFLTASAFFDTFGFPQVPFIFFILTALGTSLLKLEYSNVEGSEE